MGGGASGPGGFFRLRQRLHERCAGFVKNQALLLTGLVNPQVVRTADMVEMKCIVFVRGKVPGPDILSLAEERDIVVMTCPKRMYEACGLLYSNGLRGNCDGDN